VLQLLETFCAVAQMGSLTRGAEYLGLTQPAVTRQLRALERQLGVILVTRTPRGIALTPVGEAMLPHARQVLAAVRACQQVAAEASGKHAARLRVSAGLMATLYVLPPVVARFRALHPEVEVDLQPAHQQVALDRLLGYQVDAAVIASPVHSPQVRAVPVLDDPLLVVVGPGSELTPVRLTELQDKTVLVLASGTGLHEQIDAALRNHGVACHLVEYPNAETIKSAVALGMGISILPASAVQEELRTGVLAVRHIADWSGASRVIHILLRAEGRPPPPVTAFVTLLRDFYRSPVAT